MIPAAPPEDAWVPVPMPWRLVRTGDVFLDRTGAPWLTISAASNGTTVVVKAAGPPGVVDAIKAVDDPVEVLVPLAERASVVLLRETGIATSVLDRTG